MILYTNGCSFTQGHEDHRIIESDTGHKKDDKVGYAEWAWPGCLEGYFDHVVNEAWVGGSNDRIFRRTLEYVRSINNISDHVFIIQFTNPARSEFFDPDAGVWTGTINDMIMYDDRSTNSAIDKRVVKLLSEGQRDFEFYKLNNETIYTDFLTKLVAFDFAMSQLGCRILYTGLSSACTPMMIKRFLQEYTNNPVQYMQDPDLTEIYPAGVDMNTAKHHLALIDLIADCEDKFLHSITSQIQNQIVSKDDSHPNKVGHDFFARYILNELGSREII